VFLSLGVEFISFIVFVNFEKPESKENIIASANIIVTKAVGVKSSPEKACIHP